MDGRLLLAVDVLYKQWDNARFFSSLYDNQWIVQCGAQYKLSPSMRLRLGYVYAENAMPANPGTSAGGVNPVGANALNYVQALFANINRHRITFGVGLQDVMPGLDLDLFAGGMFDESDQFGNSSASIESYWIGMGMTWRFGQQGSGNTESCGASTESCCGGGEPRYGQ